MLPSGIRYSCVMLALPNHSLHCDASLYMLQQFTTGATPHVYVQHEVVCKPLGYMCIRRQPYIGHPSTISRDKDVAGLDVAVEDATPVDLSDTSQHITHQGPLLLLSSKPHAAHCCCQVLLVQPHHQTHIAAAPHTFGLW